MPKLEINEILHYYVLDCQCKYMCFRGLLHFGQVIKLISKPAPCSFTQVFWVWQDIPGLETHWWYIFHQCRSKWDKMIQCLLFSLITGVSYNTQRLCTYFLCSLLIVYCFELEIAKILSHKFSTELFLSKQWIIFVMHYMIQWGTFLQHGISHVYVTNFYKCCNSTSTFVIYLIYDTNEVFLVQFILLFILHFLYRKHLDI